MIDMSVNYVNLLLHLVYNFLSQVHLCKESQYMYCPGLGISSGILEHNMCSYENTKYTSESYSVIHAANVEKLTPKFR